MMKEKNQLKITDMQVIGKKKSEQGAVTRDEV